MKRRQEESIQTEIHASTFINPKSNKILKKKRYTQLKVEERLLMYGAQQKENLERMRQEQIVVTEKAVTRGSISPGKFTEKMNNYQQQKWEH